MNNSVENFMLASLFWTLIAATVTLIYLIAKKKAKSQFMRFLSIISIGTFCSLIPMGPLSMIFGFPAVLLSSIFVTLLLDKSEISK